MQPVVSESLERLIGRSEAIKALERQIDIAARTDAKVLIVGESGTGKEVAARLIHARSRRADLPLVTINCAGVPETLLESELFGFAKGSFTGADRDRVGLLEQANRGTLFLDEIGEMSLRMQGLLLRFVETGEIQRVGSDRIERSVDARIIAATNRDLSDRIASGAFRSDLFYRLNVLRLRTPPLRERHEDVPLLAEHFLDLFSGTHAMARPVLTAETVSQLSSHAWPGNVRELRNVIERLVVSSHDGVIDIFDLPSAIGSVSNEVPPQPPPRTRADLAFERMVEGREPFWAAVYVPFIERDLTREDVRAVIARGLERTSGSYVRLVELFNMPRRDYKRFLNFLSKHQCHVQFQVFRAIARPTAPAPAPA
jgi:two-component system nitrogen regulation response regulator NtrX